MHGCDSTEWVRDGNYQIPERPHGQEQSKHTNNRLKIVAFSFYLVNHIIHMQKNGGFRKQRGHEELQERG